MVAEVATTEAPAKVQRFGSFDVLPAETATPLAMVLTELLQNSVEHGLRGRAGSIELSTDRHAGRLRVVIDDDGRGLPAGFDPERSGNLGLQIVRTLVVGELNGLIDITDRDGGGTRVTIDLPAPPVSIR
jgi:two-component sensor histidine kinase